MLRPLHANFQVERVYLADEPEIRNQAGLAQSSPPIPVGNRYEEVHILSLLRGYKQASVGKPSVLRTACDL